MSAEQSFGITLPQDVFDQLNDMAFRRGESLNGALRRAIALQAMMEFEAEQGNAVVLESSSTGERRQVAIRPEVG